MTAADQEHLSASAAAPKVVTVSRSVVEGAKLRMALDRRLGIATSPLIVKIAHARRSH